MKNVILTFLLLNLFAFIGSAKDNGPRIKLNLNEGWNFHFAYDVRQHTAKEQVTLPHTWNAKDVFQGNLNYYRGTGIYQRVLHYHPDWKDKRVFLYFEGANSVADVLVNNRFVTQHRGGYTAFCAEITQQLQKDADNNITVEVSNAARADVLPLAGDFNIYGGLHRSVWLVVTAHNCISPLDYASPGIYIRTEKITAKEASISVKTRLSLGDAAQRLELRTLVKNTAGDVLLKKSSILQRGDSSAQQQFVIENPRLWQGKSDPYCYQLQVQLFQGDKLVDAVSQSFGLRSLRVDPDAGFLLNGKPYDLYGFGRHEDIEGRGSALQSSDQEKDMALIEESGATAMRLTHYPQSNYFYQLADKKGIVLWTEIPLVGPGGYTGTGYIDLPALKAHSRQLLTELIRQQYNHPSIAFWGLFNELKLDYDDPVPFLQELQVIAKKEDPARIVTCASFMDTDHFNTVSDVIAWNKYYGWYGGKFEDIGDWADDMHRKFKHKPIAVSEYGAGANINHHQEQPLPPEPGGDFHPEEWQTAYHEANWAALAKRPFIWGKFIWVLADFGSSIRTEGDFTGLNDKGLVTYDRATKKDAFYFYKANWNKEPMLYLTEKRNNTRKASTISIKAYTTLPAARLSINGKFVGRGQADSLHRVIWPHVPLLPGENSVLVQSDDGKLTDQCVIRLAE
ncbi:hypothetical protein BWD42_07765 [Sphingobacterium sp. CZ-UAM]|uniref:glycoside hydrolase family 2 protein n=1 Tax=Sphingobacterium sp. CZ-UAM TaxID=1933868 RepID=UPI0009C476EA|nr:glycoside hydrolase family 2 TIM barrel-domain containing protein [Sphingobacterium sp. CZ-UAM]OOG20376.1 hypothetical protein BWD42_07765 [Sphingobacterium sp. CZ-UAM]